MMVDNEVIKKILKVNKGIIGQISGINNYWLDGNYFKIKFIDVINQEYIICYKYDSMYYLSYDKLLKGQKNDRKEENSTCTSN